MKFIIKFPYPGKAETKRITPLSHRGTEGLNVK